MLPPGNGDVGWPYDLLRFTETNLDELLDLAMATLQKIKILRLSLICGELLPRLLKVLGNGLQEMVGDK